MSPAIFTTCTLCYVDCRKLEEAVEFFCEIPRMEFRLIYAKQLFKKILTKYEMSVL